MGITVDEILLDNNSAIKIQDSAGDELAINADGSINATVSAVDLDIRDLVFATDKVDVSGSSVTVSATDLDVRDLTHVSDSVQIGDGTDLLAVNADGSINVNTSAASLATIKNTAETVTTTAAEVVTTALVSRREITIQNEGNQAVYIGDSAGVSSANGVKVSKNASATFSFGAGVSIFMVAASGSQDVRFLEAS